MITRYALIAALVAGIAAAGWIALLQLENSALQAENERLTNRLATCSARVRNIMEDIKDDARVDDPNAFDVPDRWLLPD